MSEKWTPEQIEEAIILVRRAQERLQKPGPSGESCLTCYFFAPADTGGEADTKAEAGKWSEENHGYAGWCRRYPPAPHSNDIRLGDNEAPQPFVHVGDWCGEYKELT